MKNSRDEKTKLYLEEVKKKYESLPKFSRYNWETNCMFPYLNDKVNLHVSDINKIVEITRYLIGLKNNHEEACRELGIKINFVYGNESFENWMKDFKYRVEILKNNEEKTKFEKLMKKLEGVISEELKAEMVLNDIEKELKSDIFE